MTDLTGCSAFSASKCQMENDLNPKPGVIEKIEDVKNTQECQFYCRNVYDETCKYFMYCKKTKLCYIFNTFDVDYCSQTAGARLPDVKSCESIFFDQIDAHTCAVRLQNFQSGSHLIFPKNISILKLSNWNCRRYTIDFILF